MDFLSPKIFSSFALMIFHINHTSFHKGMCFQRESFSFLFSSAAAAASRLKYVKRLEIRCFVDYICDNTNRQCDTQEEINYLYVFKKIIQLVAISIQS